MKKYFLLMGLFFVVAAISWVYLSQDSQGQSTIVNQQKADNIDTISSTKKQNAHSEQAAGKQKIQSHSDIPQTVYQIHKYILQFKAPPPGHVGGRSFMNREKILPKLDPSGNIIKYQEWDVHAKKKGVNRGAERLVTGSDGSAYYTKDHYKTFTRL